MSGGGLKTRPDTSERLRTIQTRRNVRATFSDGQRRAAVCAHSTGRPAEAGTAGNGSYGYPHLLEIQRSVARWLHHQPPPLVRPSRNTISCFFSPPRTLIYELFVATAHSRYWHRPTVGRCCGRRVRSWGQLTFQKTSPDPPAATESDPHVLASRCLLRRSNALFASPTSYRSRRARMRTIGSF